MKIFKTLNLGTSWFLFAVSAFGISAHAGTSPPAAPPPLTLAIRYISYVDDQGKPVMTADQAQTVITGVNALYKTCGIQFTMEEYKSVTPKDFGLIFDPTSMSDLPIIRAAFDEPNRLVVINTGAWDHSGGLGSDGANAWTAMPGDTPSGAVLEASVANFAGIVAHELGHSLGLDHVQDQSDLMNPVIYPTSTTITADQCSTVRETAGDARKASLRG